VSKKSKWLSVAFRSPTEWTSKVNADNRAPVEWERVIRAVDELRPAVARIIGGPSPYAQRIASLYRELEAYRWLDETTRETNDETAMWTLHELHRLINLDSKSRAGRKRRGYEAPVKQLVRRIREEVIDYDPNYDQLVSVLKRLSRLERESKGQHEDITVIGCGAEDRNLQDESNEDIEDRLSNLLQSQSPPLPVTDLEVAQERKRIGKLKFKLRKTGLEDSISLGQLDNIRRQVNGTHHR
jgi:hypothetical protein